MKLDLSIFSFWATASTRRKRIYSFLIVLVAGFIMVAIGSVIPISSSSAHNVYNQLNSTVSQNVQSGTIVQYIFLNNFRICLMFFIPIFGPLFGVVSFVTTGYYIGAEAKVQGIPPLLYVGLEPLSPIFWLEFTAYSIAIAESFWLLRRLLQQRFSEAKILLICIGICAALLAVGAIIESMLPLV